MGKSPTARFSAVARRTSKSELHLMREPHIESQKAEWSAPPHVKALTTFRTGGVSRGVFDSLNLAMHVGDDPIAVRRNRIRLLDQLSLPSEPIWLHQVHGRRIVKAESFTRGYTADGSFSRELGIVCAVLTADCVPLFLTDMPGSFVSVLHVGWRGLATGLIESGLAALGSKPHELLCWVGPGIGPDKFVVGSEVCQQLTQQHPKHIEAFAKCGKKWRADLGFMIEQRLRWAGVLEVWRSEECTAKNNSTLFSCRRDGRCGRMASLIWLT